jgi:hypothetical protein
MKEPFQRASERDQSAGSNSQKGNPFLLTALNSVQERGNVHSWVRARVCMIFKSNSICEDLGKTRTCCDLSSYWHPVFISIKWNSAMRIATRTIRGITGSSNHKEEHLAI